MFSNQPQLHPGSVIHTDRQRASVVQTTSCPAIAPTIQEHPPSTEIGKLLGWPHLPIERHSPRCALSCDDAENLPRVEEHPGRSTSHGRLGDFCGCCGRPSSNLNQATFSETQICSVGANRSLSLKAAKAMPMYVPFVRRANIRVPHSRQNTRSRACGERCAAVGPVMSTWRCSKSARAKTGEPSALWHCRQCHALTLTGSPSTLKRTAPHMH